MKVDIITLFPELFASFLEWSMIKKAREIKALNIKIHNLRRWGIDKRGSVDDHPYGRGDGMILRPEPIFSAIKALKKSKVKSQKSKVILTDPRGKLFTQKKANLMAKIDHMILICGHYEGVDERIRQHLVDEEISIGNYVLSGGELPAMVIVDSISRLLSGVLKKEGASQIESFSPGLSKMTGLKSKILTEFPQYTRPPDFIGWKVPEVLVSGNHKEILRWQVKNISSKATNGNV